MEDDSPVSSWFEPERAPASEVPGEFARIWPGFMTARFTRATLVMVLQLALYASGLLHSRWQALISLLYLTGALVTGLFGAPRMLGSTFNRNWLELVGLDLIAFTGLQSLHGTNISYTPLFALPMLLTAVLGSRQLALGTAAVVTVLLLGSTDWSYNSADTTSALVQAALSGVGFFAMALLGNQMATRLVSASEHARRNQAAARVQRQVNSLVIETLPDGIMIVDGEGRVRAANPAAVAMLSPQSGFPSPLTDLRDEAAWAPLLNLARASLHQGEVQSADIQLALAQYRPRKVLARARPTALQEIDGEKLCVLFLQDQRELESRVRTEKLASMGRMSTAVAHEIRNPLAAITQANALLEEDLTDPRHRQLTRMVGDNSRRLARIVDDILNLSRVQPHDAGVLAPPLALNATVQTICREWAQQNRCENQLALHCYAGEIKVPFDAEHLRRVLINLLDNALRFTSQQPGSLRVATGLNRDGCGQLSVWSDGGPLEPQVLHHLFEPFVSSASRSSGLGLYICRELCQRHGAQIAYQRTHRAGRDGSIDGNEFALTFAVTGA